MAFEISQTTAENTIEAINATILKKTGADVEYVARFMDTDEGQARAALKMATQLGFISENAKDVYTPDSRFAGYLVTGDKNEQTAVFRIFLDRFEPYELFKERLIITGSARQAAQEVKAFYGISASRDDISITLLDLGTFTKSITSRGSGVYEIGESSGDQFSALNVILENREAVETFLVCRFGPEVLRLIDREEVLNPLIIAYQILFTEAEGEFAVMQAGNAVESFLTQIGTRYGIDVSGISGINGKADELARNGSLKKKHKNMLKYLGHIRNAADHGIDDEIGKSWDITPETATEYVHVATSTIKALAAASLGNYFL